MTTLYTLQEVAERTGFALRTLQRDARAGKIAHLHRGRARLMTEEHIQELIKASDTRYKADADSEARLDKVRAMMARSKR